ncbi:intron Large complex component GCFC2 [Rhinophrynus dorsalis]
MFRKPNRALRVRKAESSEEEDQEEDVEQPRVNRQRKSEGRGLTCGTNKKKSRQWEPVEEGSDSEDDEGEKEAGEGHDFDSGPAKTGKPHVPCSLLSFSEEREGEVVSFKIKKPLVNAVVFKVQKKTENGNSTDKPNRNGEIPDAKTIKAARRQRKLARAKGDYIALDTKPEISGSSQSESSDDLDDHEKRIKFAPGTKTLREQMAKEMSSTIDSDFGEKQEDDDLQDEWEEQQIRKAIKYPKAIDMDDDLVHKPQPIKRPVEPKFSLPPVTVQDIKKKLVKRLNSFQEVHRSHVQEQEKFSRDLESSKNSLEMLEKTSCEQSYKFYKEMKTFIENFVDCVNEKVTQIIELESEMFEILQQRASTLLKRRQNDLLNESAAIQKLSGIGKSENRDAEDMAPNLLGECVLRRCQRQQKREQSGETDHCDGMSSDDEVTPDEERAFKEHRDRIVLQCKNLFDDVHEDFHCIKNILSRFCEWRKRFPESYYDAYISLCLHKLLNPLIRVQLIDWNPLENNQNLEQMGWYHDIEEFSSSRDDPEMNEEDSPDQKVLSAVIEKTLIPKVSGFVEHLWDPMSSVQTDNLVRFCKAHVLDSESNKAVQGLVSCLVSRMKKAIEDDIFIPLYNKSVLEDRNSPHSKFQERQFWSAVKMLRNVLSWDGFLQEETLQELGLDKLLNRYLLLILLNVQPGSENVRKCRKVVECLPQSWFRGLESGKSLHRLANFSKHLRQCVHELHKVNNRENMNELVSLLVKIKALDYADEAISQYNMEWKIDK